jgi:DNA-binding transcriptional MerR regulator
MKGSGSSVMPEKKLMKMKDLSEVTGVSSGTIRYYIQEGLLPKPVKTHKNMAYYDESYIERIRLIKQLQKSRYLPLDIIKKMIADMDLNKEGDHLKILREIEKPSYEDVRDSEQVQPMTRDEVIAHTGLPASDVDAMIGMQMISPDENGRFDTECIRIAEIVAEMRQTGLTTEFDFYVEHLQTHMDLIEFMARKEIDLFTRRVADREMSQERLNTLVRNAVNCINSMLPIIHFRMIRKISEEYE